jgi:hypothetical protein
VQEQKMMERHILRGEDPEDMQIFLEDVRASFAETARLLKKMADEMGVQLDAAPPPIRRRRKKRDDPLEVRSRRWMDRIGLLLERLHTDFAALSQTPEVQKAAGWLPSNEEEAQRLVEGLTAVRDGIDLLARFRYLVAVKISRAVDSMRESKSEDRYEGGIYMLQDSLRTARLVRDCLVRAEAALWPIGEINGEWRQEAISLVMETQALRQAMEERFPGWKDERRPGFDDDPGGSASDE